MGQIPRLAPLDLRRPAFHRPCAHVLAVVYQNRCCPPHTQEVSPQQILCCLWLHHFRLYRPDRRVFALGPLLPWGAGLPAAPDPDYAALAARLEAGGVGYVWAKAV